MPQFASRISIGHYWALADRLAQADRRFEFGPGRHGGGGPGQISGYGTNLFAYAFDPTGNRNEFSGDMKEYPDDEPMVTIQAPPDLGKVMNLWADNMPESFMTVGT
jgi:catechol 2,3-dioxygenase